MTQLEQGNITILMLIENMERFLTSKDEKVWRKATELIAYSLFEIPHLMLDEQQIEALVYFFVDKLKDIPCSTGAFKSIYALLRFHAQSINRNAFNKIYESMSHRSLHV